jgi:PcfJ-like protein
MTAAYTTTQAARYSAKPFPNPVGLLRDERGIYGLGLTDEYLEADLPKELLNYEGTPPRDNKLILRPDRINEACGYRHPPILQMLPRGFRETQECDLRDEMVKVMHYCSGDPLGRIGFTDADHRRRYHGLPIKATRIINSMIRQVIAVADPEALRVARRFTISSRWWIYEAGICNRRALQLAESFPVLAYLIYIRELERDRALDDPGLAWPWEQYEQRMEALRLRRKQRCNAATEMVDRGVRLRDIAAIWELPMVLRRIKPGAIHMLLSHQFPTLDLFRRQPEFLDHIPEPLPRQRRWLYAVRYARNLGGDDYAAWVARNWSNINNFHELEDIADWIRAPRAPAEQINRPFVSSMSGRTVRERGAQWHELVAQAKESEERLFPQPWFPTANLINGYEVVPITNSADLYREGKAMHHCVGSYTPEILIGRKYIYSVREGDNRIATFELVRNGHARPALGQIRGNCNAHVPKEITEAVRRWLRVQKWDEAAPRRHTGETLAPPDEFWRAA